MPNDYPLGIEIYNRSRAQANGVGENPLNRKDGYPVKGSDIV